MPRFASYLKDGDAAFGVVVDGGFVTRGHGTDTLLQALRQGNLDELAGQEKVPDIGPDAQLLPLLPRPPRIFCIGMNYRDHAREMASVERRVPGFFLKDASTLVAHGGIIRVPAASEQLDYEGELAVVIGRAGRRIPEQRALDHVAGYTCFSDGSVRDFQKDSTGAGKNFPNTSPLGPFLTTTGEIGDPSSLRLRTLLNGQTVQDAPLTLMLSSVQACIAYISLVTDLQPGDIIATGSPGGTGAGASPPRWLQPRDVLEVYIGPVGRLSVRVAAEDARQVL